MKTFKFSLVLRTRENTDVFITLDDNIYGIHRKRVNILYVPAGQCHHNVTLKSTRCRYIAATSKRRCIDVVFLLGSFEHKVYFQRRLENILFKLLKNWLYKNTTMKVPP